MSEDRYRLGQYGFLYDTWPDPPQEVVSAVGNNGPIAPIISDDLLEFINGWAGAMDQDSAEIELLKRSRDGYQHDAQIATSILRQLIACSQASDLSQLSRNEAVLGVVIAAEAYLGSMRGEK